MIMAEHPIKSRLSAESSPPPQKSAYYKHLAGRLIEEKPSKPKSKTSKKIAVSNIFNFNRRLTPTELVPEKLKKEFNDAQTHLRECQAYAFQWAFARPEACVEPIDTEVSGEAGIAHLQGYRPTMEDEHIAITLALKIKGRTSHIPLYGIFDGHGGLDCAHYLKENLAAYLTEHLERTLAQCRSKKQEDAAIFNTLKLAFVDLGADYQQLPNRQGGSTANIAIIYNKTLWVANVGDTRAILVHGDQAIALSEDAKPHLKKYKQGVESRHSVVVKVQGIARVGGNLATARAVGHDEIISGINPRAKIIKYDLRNLHPGEKCFLLIACDGLWDIVSSEKVAHTVRQLEHNPAVEIAEILVRKAFQAGSLDNISVLVVPLGAD